MTEAVPECVIAEIWECDDIASISGTLGLKDMGKLKT